MEGRFPIMNPITTLCIDSTGILLVWFAVRLVCRRQLSTALGAVWIVSVLGLMALVSIPPLYHGWAWMSSALTSTAPGLLALALILVGLVLHLSVVVSTLQRQVRELCQHVSLRDSLAAPPGGERVAREETPR